MVIIEKNITLENLDDRLVVPCETDMVVGKRREHGQKLSKYSKITTGVYANSVIQASAEALHYKLATVHGSKLPDFSSPL